MFLGVHPAVCFCVRLMDFIIFMFFEKGVDGTDFLAGAIGTACRISTARICLIRLLRHILYKGRTFEEGLYQLLVDYLSKADII